MRLGIYLISQKSSSLMYEYYCKYILKFFILLILSNKKIKKISNYVQKNLLQSIYCGVVMSHGSLFIRLFLLISCLCCFNLVAVKDARLEKLRKDYTQMAPLDAFFMAVTSNDVDYVGQTIHILEKIEDKALIGDILIAATANDAVGVANLIVGCGVHPCVSSSFDQTAYQLAIESNFTGLITLFSKIIELRTKLEDLIISGSLQEFITTIEKEKVNVNWRNSDGLTLLMKACASNFENDSEIVNYLLFIGAEVNMQSYMGNTALHMAVSANNAAKVRKLIQASASLDIKNSAGLLPIDIAFNNQYSEVLLELINACNNAFETSDTVMTKFKPTFVASCSRILLMLRNCQASSMEPADFQDVHESACGVVRWLITDYQNEESTYENWCANLLSNNSPGSSDLRLVQARIVEAVAEGDIAYLQFILPKLYKKMSGEFAGDLIVGATARGNADVVKLLLDVGIYPATPNRNGHTVFNINSGQTSISAPDLFGPVIELRRKVIDAMQSGKFTVFKNIIESRNFNINSRDEAGTTLIIQSCRIIQDTANKMIKYLLERGADVNLRGYDGTTPLQIAVLDNNLARVRLLLKYGALATLPAKDGATPLEIAFRLRLVDVFIELGKAIVKRDETNEDLVSKFKTEFIEDCLQVIADMEAITADCIDKKELESINAAAKFAITWLIDNYENDGANYKTWCLKHATQSEPGCLKLGRERLKRSLETDDLTFVRLLEQHDEIIDEVALGSALAQAVGNNKIALVRALIKAGVHPRTCAGLSACAYDVALSMEADRREMIDLFDQVIGKREVCIKAIDSNDFETINSLANGGFNFNMKDEQGITPIMNLSGRSGKPDLDMATLLVAKGAKINQKSYCGSTALHFALQEGHEDFIEHMIRLGANVDIGLPDGSTAARLAIRRRIPSVLITLLNAGANVQIGMSNQQRFENEVLKLCSAFIDRIKKVKQAAMEAQKDVSKVNPLIGISLILESYHAEFDTLEQLYLSILRRAIKYPQINLMLLMLNYINLNSPECLKPYPLLHEAVLANNYRAAEILIRRGVSVNALFEQEQASALFWTAWSGHSHDNARMVQLLLNNGAHINLCNKSKLTPLMEAASWSKLKVVEALLQRKADTELRDRNGATAVILAAKAGHMEVVKLLHEYGADITATDIFGKSALDYANELNRTEVIKYLEPTRNNMVRIFGTQLLL